MKPIVIHITPWTGDHPTGEGEEIAATLVRRVMIGDEEIPYAKASIHWDGPEDFLTLRLEGVPNDFVIEDPSDWLMGTDLERGILLLPVRGVEMGMVDVPFGLVRAPGP